MTDIEAIENWLEQKRLFEKDEVRKAPHDSFAQGYCVGYLECLNCLEPHILKILTHLYNIATILDPSGKNIQFSTKDLLKTIRKDLDE